MIGLGLGLQKYAQFDSFTTYIKQARYGQELKCHLCVQYSAVSLIICVYKYSTWKSMWCVFVQSKMRNKYNSL